MNDIILYCFFAQLLRKSLSHCLTGNHPWRKDDAIPQSILKILLWHSGAPQWCWAQLLPNSFQNALLPCLVPNEENWNSTIRLASYVQSSVSHSVPGRCSWRKRPCLLTETCLAVVRHARVTVSLTKAYQLKIWLYRCPTWSDHLNGICDRINEKHLEWFTDSGIKKIPVQDEACYNKRENKRYCLGVHAVRPSLQTLEINFTSKKMVRILKKSRGTGCRKGIISWTSKSLSEMTRRCSWRFLFYVSEFCTRSHHLQHARRKSTSVDSADPHNRLYLGLLMRQVSSFPHRQWWLCRCPNGHRCWHASMRRLPTSVRPRQTQGWRRLWTGTDEHSCHKWNTKRKIASSSEMKKRHLDSIKKRVDEDDYYSMNGHVQSLSVAAVTMCKKFSENRL